MGIDRGRNQRGIKKIGERKSSDQKRFRKRGFEKEVRV